MIIGIDVSSIPYGTGVSNYTLNLIKNLIKIDKTNTYKLFFSSFRLPLPKEIETCRSHKNVQIYHFKYPLSFLNFLWNKLHLIPIECFIGKCDVFHTSDWTQPPAIKAKLITTVHDLVPFLFPQWSSPKIIKTHRLKMKKAIKKCHQIICVSQNTKNDLIKIFPKVKTEKIKVIYEAAEDKYGQFQKLDKKSQQKKLEIIKKQYGLNHFLLCQGTREPRKNLKRVIKAFLMFKQKYPTSKYELAIGGKYGWGEDIKKYRNGYIKLLGYIPEQHMVALHASALALIYPSLYEGFGLPIVKSMKVGTPVITSKTSSMKEIAGNAAIFVNPKSTKSIFTAIEKMCKSSSTRNNLAKRAINLSQKFSWTQTALETLNVYNKV
jgi:glycosyltransferase involved in cell wall biosynthesis